MKKSRRVLLICNESIRLNMTGPAIRYWEFAKVLSNYFCVTLAVPPFAQDESSASSESPSSPSKTLAALNPTFEVSFCKTQAALQRLTRDTDVIVTVGANLSIYPFLAKTNKPLVVDMYIPFMLEDLQKHRDKPIREQNAFYDGNRGSHTLQVRSADFIICASEKQKDFWLGWLGAVGRVNPYTHRDDPALSKLIDVVPFGLSHETPLQDRPVLKGVYKTIAPDDQVILWGGGIWTWLDPQTLIRAMVTVSQRYPKAKLFFMGIKSPHPSSAKMNAAARSIELSQALGLYDRYVFFNDWTPYQERHNYLLEADIGASLHRNHIETRFAFRTRLLDYIWTGLPVLVTEGDVLSEEVRRFRLGKVVKSGAADQVSRALLDLLETPHLRQHYKPNFDRIRATYEWENVVQPLIRFCEAPYFSADRSYLKHIPLVESGVSSGWSLPAKFWRIARLYGLAELSRKTREYLWWKWQK